MKRIGQWFRQFMAGRYGTDKLNIAILWTAVVIMVLSIFLQDLQGLLTVVYYGLMFLAIYRTFSRNTYKRYQENRRYLQLVEQVKDRQNRYFNCPHCRQRVRVPRGKGKISISCPKCREKFTKKT